MCLILLAKNYHSSFKFIIAANRDEFHSRPTAPASWWMNNTVLSGIDLQGKGTWLGIDKYGRFTAITNYRDPSLVDNNRASRGELTHYFLKNKIDNNQFLTKLKLSYRNYNPYNILFGNVNTTHHYSNISNNSTLLNDGIHGLSNHLMDSPWPKVIKSKNNLMNILKNDNFTTDDIFKILTNKEIVNDLELPKTGISPQMEKMLSPIFIQTPEYGTRCSTIILVDNDNITTFIERSYNNQGLITDEISFKFEIVK